MNCKTILTLIIIVISLDQFACDGQDFNCDNEMLTKCKCSKFKDSFIVDCSNTGLKAVPTGIPTCTTHLYLNNNDIDVLRNNSFAHSQGGLPNIVTLSIRSNGMSRVEIKALDGLNNLKELDLYNNSLKSIDSYPESVFEPISQSLEVLDIRQNLLGDITEMDYPVSVGELTGLRELRIDCLRNKSLPLEYGKLKNVTKMSFADGRKGLGFVSDDMFLAVAALNVTHIDFAGLDIGFIGNDTFLNLLRLKTLDVSNNKFIGYHIENIIPALKKTSIEILKLNDTGMGQERLDLTTILKKLGELHLKQLTLDSNMFSKFSNPIFSKHFPDLEVLSLGNNLLGSAITLTDDIMKMKHLIGLNVSWQHKFSKEPISPAVPVLHGNGSKVTVGVICQPHMACILILPPKLQWIDLSHSRYAPLRLPKFAMLQNTSLKSLDASYNGIHYIENPVYCEKTNASSVVPQIETINLNNNALECINSSFFSHCDASSLKRVFLRNNRLGNIEGNFCNRDKNNILGFLKPAINLEVMDLAGNKIQNDSLLSDIGLLSKLKEIDLAFNGFHNFPVVLQNMTGLRKVNLSNNNIGCLSLSTIITLDKIQIQIPEPEKIEVDLSGNLLSCSCKCFDFFQWMMGTKVILTDMDKYQCKFNDGRKEYLNELDFIVAKLESQCFGTQWLKVCLSAEAVIYFLITLACVFYRRRYDIKYFFLKIKLNRYKLKSILDVQNYTYSAFISCDHRDTKYFVYRKFLPSLETPQTKLRFCIAQRNFLVGATILDNIMRAINKSQKVIFIVSEYFLASKWCQEELRIAHQVSFECSHKYIS